MNEQKIILADTNVVYKLYFFISSNVIPFQNIIIENLGKIEFHPIVLDEVLAHSEAWRIAKELKLAKGEWPNVFDFIQEEGIKKIEAFVEQNICNDIEEVNTKGPEYLKQKKIYEQERKGIQSEWKKSGVKGRKITSVPTDNDYSLLYSAENEKLVIVTNDEILLAVASEFLNDGQTLKFEDVMWQIYKNDENLEGKIKEVISTLETMGEVVQVSRIFSR